jgi:hypothetical protein
MLTRFLFVLALNSFFYFISKTHQRPCPPIG